MYTEMTIFFMKSTGNIKSVVTGNVDFDIFGQEEDDYKSIFGRILIDYDDFVMNNIPNHKVVDGKLIFER